MIVASTEKEQAMKPVSREEAIEIDNAHADGWHAEFPREGCPSCDGRRLTSYPTKQQIRDRKVASVDG